MTAFAFGRLARVNTFHRSPGNSVTLEHPFSTAPPEQSTVIRAEAPYAVIDCSLLALRPHTLIKSYSLITAVGRVPGFLCARQETTPHRNTHVRHHGQLGAPRPTQNEEGQPQAPQVAP